MTETATTPDLTARSEALRADAEAIVTKTREFGTEIWGDLKKLATDGYELAKDRFVKKEEAPAEAANETPAAEAANETPAEKSAPAAEKTKEAEKAPEAEKATAAA